MNGQYGDSWDQNAPEGFFVQATPLLFSAVMIHGSIFDGCKVVTHGTRH